MKMLRRVIGDRASATAMAVLAAYLLLLQGFVGGMTRSAMAASAVDPLHVICVSTGTMAADLPSGDTGSSKAGTDCPCASLCRLAATAPVAILPGATLFDPQTVHRLHAAPSGAPQEVVVRRRGLLPEPRAPPAIS